jgi:hypothetical protein
MPESISPLLPWPSGSEASLLLGMLLLILLWVLFLVLLLLVLLLLLLLVWALLRLPPLLLVQL